MRRVAGLYLAVLAASAGLFFAKLGGWIPVVLLLGAIAGTYMRLDDTPRTKGYGPMLWSALDGIVLSLIVLPIFVGAACLLRHAGLLTFEFGLPVPRDSQAAAPMIRYLAERGTAVSSVVVSLLLFAEILVVQVLVAGIPEEMFFRATIQKGFDKHLGMRWKLLGVPFGPSLFLTAVLFGIAHVFTQGPFGLTTAFPALLFGLLYEKRQSITGAVFFHVACNLTLHSLVGIFNFKQG